MASVDWKKMTTQQAGAMIRHNGQKERVETKHSNKDINPELTHLNFTLGADDYRDMVDRLKERVTEADKNHPPIRVRSDRVTCVMLEAPCPLEIQNQGKDREFFAKLHQVYCDFFGTKNVMGSCVHYDEQHDYVDRDGERRRSLAHAHTLVAAYATWKEKGKEREGINGHHFYSRDKPAALNRKIQEMVKKEFDCDYNTGVVPRKEKTEEMKRKSKDREEMLERVAAAPIQAKLPTKGTLENKVKHAEKVREAITPELLSHLRDEMEAEYERKDKARRDALNAEEKAFRERKAEEERQLSEYKADVERRISWMMRKINDALRWIKAQFSPSEQRAADEHYQHRLLLRRRREAAERTRRYGRQDHIHSRGD